MDRRDLTSFADADRLVNDFERVLDRFGIRVGNGSPLEQHCLFLKEFVDQHNRPQPDYVLDPEKLQAGVGMLDVIKKVLRRHDHPDFERLLPHLALLNDGSAVQNARTPVTDQTSNKLFELFVALAAMEHGRDMRIDDPHASKGDNPDVLVTYDGVRWALACKVIHSDRPETLFDRIVEGVNQIERSEASVGIAMVSLKNRLPHDQLFPVVGDDNGMPIVGVYPSLTHAQGAIQHEVNLRYRALRAAIDPTAIRDTFAGRKSLPGYLTVTQVGVGIRSTMGPVPSSVGLLGLNPLESLDDGSQTRFTNGIMRTLTAINLGFHNRTSV